jgi:hypothetical protein
VTPRIVVHEAYHLVESVKYAKDAVISAAADKSADSNRHHPESGSRPTENVSNISKSRFYRNF